MTSKKIPALAAALSLPLAAGAHAQPQGPDIQALHQALHLSPAQEQAWHAFTAATQPDPSEMARERSAAQMLPTLPAPRRVDLSIAMARTNLQSMEQKGGALKAFYETLSLEQKATFDRMTAPSSGR